MGSIDEWRMSCMMADVMHGTVDVGCHAWVQLTNGGCHA
jgi:hypothetical protein